MKVLAVLLLVSIVVAKEKEFQMKIDENGEKFVEDVKVDVTGNTEEMVVPQHADRLAVDVLNDFNVGYSAMKVFADKVCYISVLGKEQTPAQMKKSLEVSKGRFPVERYMVKSYKVIRLYKMSKAEVGKKIAAHCGAYDIIFTVKFNKENIDKDVDRIIKAHKRKRSKHIRTLEACDRTSEKIVGNCPEHRIDRRCKIYRNGRKTCVYKIDCIYDMPYGWKCSGRHNWNRIWCCDYICR